MLVVADIGQSVDFYTTHFGFTVREQEDYIALLENHGMLLYFVLESEPTPDKPDVALRSLNDALSTSVNLVFRVDDCRKVYQMLSEAGLAFLAPPHSPSWGGWRCFVRDPDGYLIEIEEA